MTGTDMLHVPYKGDAAPRHSGEVQLAFMPLAGVLPHIKSGRLRLR
jgi:tripartite-type tricarboxylate transporter receptor subunit TctC